MQHKKISQPLINGNISLGRIAFHGAFWNISITVINKVITTIGQILIAWFLVPGDLGLVAMAASINSIAAIFTANGLDDLLIQRHSKYNKDAPQIFWISICLNLFALMFVLLLTVLVTKHYGDVRIANLMLIQAISWPFSSISLVLVPKLRNQLRFKSLAIMNLGEGFIFTGSCVFFAAIGFGSYAMVWPIFIRTLFSALMSWWLVKKLPINPPDTKKWLQYLKPGSLLILGNFISIITVQLPIFIIGNMLNENFTGIFSWGYLVSSQLVFLLAINLRGIFTPLFSKLNKSIKRRSKVIVKSLHILMTLVVPICVTQAFLATPMIKMLFPVRWFPAIPVIIWLSLGFVLQPVAVIAFSAFIAMGKNKTYFSTTLIQAGLISFGVYLGCIEKDVEKIAKGAALGMALCLPMYYLTLGKIVGARTILKTLKPVIISALAGIPAYIVLLISNENNSNLIYFETATLYAVLLVVFSLCFDKDEMMHLYKVEIINIVNRMRKKNNMSWSDYRSNVRNVNGNNDLEGLK